MKQNYKIVIADDDPHILEIVTFAIEQEGYEVFATKNGKEAFDQFQKVLPDLVILDISMPELDGTEVCKKIRKESEVPILFLSSKADEIDRIVGFEIGADDYVVKPFSPRELVARVKAILKRSASKAQKSDKLTTVLDKLQSPKAMVEMDLLSLEATCQGSQVNLTKIELLLLKVFLKSPKQVLSRNQLIDKVHGDDVALSERAIDAHIKRLRQKFSPFDVNPIKTVHGFGYRLSNEI